MKLTTDAAHCTIVSDSIVAVNVINRQMTDVVFDMTGLQLTTSVWYLHIGTYADAPDWSPDGTQIVFTTIDSQSKISVVNPDGTGLRKLTNGYNPSWSPDSRQIVFADASGLLVMKADGSQLRRIMSGSYGSPVWRP